MFKEVCTLLIEVSTLYYKVAPKKKEKRRLVDFTTILYLEVKTKRA